MRPLPDGFDRSAVIPPQNPSKTPSPDAPVGAFLRPGISLEALRAAAHIAASPMKQIAIALAALAYSAGLFAQPVPSSEVNVSLRLPAAAMIGEEIQASLVVENRGTSPCSITTGGDYRSTGYPQRVKVRVQDENGNDLPGLPGETYGGGGGGLIGSHTIPPGKSEAIDFPLECYVSFRKPGVYRITASHDLGWAVDAAHPRSFAQATLTVTEPTEAQATAVVEKLFASRPPVPSDRDAVFGYEMDFEKQLSVLRHPHYLPSLAKAARDGSVAAVAGIGHIATPEATQVLLELLDYKTPELVTESTRQLLRRVPSPEDRSRTALGGRWEWSAYQIDALLPSSWNSRFEKPLLAAAVKMLESTDVEVVQVGALLIQARGDAEQAPAILASLQRSLDIHQPPRIGPNANTLDAPAPQQMLINALAALRQRGWRTEAGGDVAHMIAWFCQLADPTIPPPKDESWKDRMLTWVENGPATLRMHALLAIPHPMPDIYEQPLLRALDNPDGGVQRVACEVAGKSKRPIFARPLTQIVETAQENFLQYAAVDAAFECGARYELWQALAAVIPNQDRMVYVIGRLVEGTIELPESKSGGGNSNFNRDQRFVIRDAWRAFLELQHEPLSAGNRVRLTDPVVIAALTGMNLRPEDPVVERNQSDGTRWPPRPKN